LKGTDLHPTFDSANEQMVMGSNR